MSPEGARMSKIPNSGLGQYAKVQTIGTVGF